METELVSNERIDSNLKLYGQFGIATQDIKMAICIDLLAIYPNETSFERNRDRVKNKISEGFPQEVQDCLKKKTEEAFKDGTTHEKLRANANLNYLVRELKSFCYGYKTAKKEKRKRPREAKQLAIADSSDRPKRIVAKIGESTVKSGAESSSCSEYETMSETEKVSNPVKGKSLTKIRVQHKRIESIKGKVVRDLYETAPEAVFPIIEEIRKVFSEKENIVVYECACGKCLYFLI